MCPGSVFWAMMYIAWACFQNVISVIASQMFYICALVNCFLPNQNQAFVTLLLMLYCFISSLFICDSYATMWWPIIGNKFYSILFYSILAPSNHQNLVGTIPKH